MLIIPTDIRPHYTLGIDRISFPSPASIYLSIRLSVHNSIYLSTYFCIHASSVDICIYVYTIYFVTNVSQSVPIGVESTKCVRRDRYIDTDGDTLKVENNRYTHKEPFI